MARKGQNGNDYITELLSIGPFGGLDTTTDPYFVAPSNFVSGVNWIPNQGYGGFVTPRGRSRWLAAPLPGLCTGMHRFRVPGSPEQFMFAVTVSGVGYLYLGTAGSTATVLSCPPLTPNLQTTFADSLHWVFINNGTDRPLMYNVNTGLVTNWGIDKPLTAPILSASATPSTMNGWYAYSVTFGNAELESSQGPIAGFPGGSFSVTGTGVDLSAIPVSSDPQTTERNIYRIGEFNGQWLLVHTIPDNVTSTYTDTTPDNLLVGQTLTPFRDPAPPFVSFCEKESRIWGVDATSLVWYSNTGEPWAFNSDVGTLPAGMNSFSDVPVGICGLGTTIVVMKTKSMYQVAGIDPTDFDAQFLFKIGSTSLRSITAAYGACWWVSHEGVFQLDGGAPQNISDGGYQQSNIKSVFDTLTEEELGKITTFAYERMIFVSIPTRNLTYLWDMRSQAWYPLGWATDQVAVDRESLEAIIATNLQTPGQIDSWFSSEGDFGSPILSELVSRISDSGDTRATKTYDFISVAAPIQDATLAVTLTSDPGAANLPDVIVVDLSLPSAEVRYIDTVGLEGTEIQLTLRVRSIAQVRLQKVAVYGHGIRILRKS